MVKKLDIQAISKVVEIGESSGGNENVALDPSYGNNVAWNNLNIGSNGGTMNVVLGFSKNTSQGSRYLSN